MSHLPEDFHDLLRSLDAIAGEECPETMPYAAQYRVIEILQKLRTTHVAPIEKAVAAAKLGATYLAVEEPHNAQPALEEAGNFFFSELVKFTTDITLDDGSQGQEVGKKAVSKLLAEMPQELYFECAEINADVFELKQSKDSGEKAMANMLAVFLSSE
ncbi:hypothetical protein PRIC2_004763 [Phytophthora ramorum]